MDKDEALKMALEALEESKTTDDSMEFHDRKNNAITAIKQALAAPVQEPVAWRLLDKDPLGGTDDRWAYFDKSEFQNGVDPAKLGLEPLYITPPQREWVGLTDEEMDYWVGCNSTKKGLCRVIGKKLREKNT